MRVSVAICTWNRCELLAQTLEQMTRLSIPDGTEWELLVVNNNCSDATDAVLDRFAAALPLRRIFEPKPGKSYAANTAVREATGEYILWTDDDVLVDPNWMAAYCDAFARWPDASIFGGPIEPWFAGTPPQWLETVFPHVANAYAALNLGTVAVPLSHNRYPYGANMALRRAAHLRIPYAETLGPRPGVSLRGEEMVLVRALLDAGETGWWVPGARVRHYIPESRQTLDYLRSYYAGSGRLLGMLGRDRSAAKLFGRPLWLWRQAIESQLRYSLRRPFSEPGVWIEDLKLAHLSWAQLRWYTAKPTSEGSG